MNKIIKNISLKLLPVWAGIIVFTIFFTYGVINNLSFSYMGNSSERMVLFIIENFWHIILQFMGKLIIFYLILGAIWGIVSHFCIVSVEIILNKKFKTKLRFFLQIIIIIVPYILIFFKNIVMYPQVYVNGFYTKNSFNHWLMNSLTDYTSPTLYSSILMLIIFTFILTGLFALIKLNQKHVYYKASAFFVIFLVLFLISSIKINPGLSKNTNSKKPNILILASDALRPDHLSANGYFRETSPNMDKLINTGVNFENTFIEVPRTFPSWVSTLTGQYSATHGIRHMFPTSRDVNHDFKSIVKILKSNGYYTAAVADYAGDIFTRIELGFEKVDTPFFNLNAILKQAILEPHVFIMPFLTNKFGLELFDVLKDSAYFCPPDLLKERVIKSINQSSNRPFFITTFFSSTHFPYAPPYPYYKKYAEQNYNGPYRFLKQKIISLDGQEAEKEISKKDIKQVNALYDGGIKAFDDSVGGIIDYLDKTGLRDNTIIIILADHGENLYEENLGMGHGEHFRGKYAIKVPFVINYNKLKNKTIKNVVRQVDIAPTILELTNIKIPGTIEGKSVLSMVNTNKKIKQYAYGETGIWFDNSLAENLFFQKLRIMYPDITYLSVTDFNFRNQIVLNDKYRDIINFAKHRYVFDGRYKLIYMPLKDRVEYELYDTYKDKNETINIVKKDKYNFNRLKKKLFEWITRNKDVIIKNDYIFPILRY